VEDAGADNPDVALTAVRPAATPDPVAPAPPGRGWVWAAAGIALVLPVASAPVAELPTWALRWALLPAVASLGLPLLVAFALRPGSGRRPARWALGWLAWAALATALAPQPVVAFWGEYRVGTGWVMLAAVAGAWAIGARAGERGARTVASALLAGCVVNAAVAVASQLVNLSSLGMEPFAGRSVGFYGNPVYLAELLCGGLWLALVRLATPARRGLAVAAGGLVAAAVELSGSRTALALAVAAGVVAVVRLRGRARLLAALVVAGGIALGAAVAAVAPASTTGTDRVTSIAVADAGVSPRLDTWRGGLSALGTRPLWGWGPGGTLAAAGPRRTLRVARDEGPDLMFADAHDLLVEAAVTTGLVGLGLLLLWVASAVAAARRRPTGEGLLGFAALAVAATLAEPMHVGITPLAALALGAAASWGLRPAARARRAAAAAGLAVGAAGVLVTGWLIAGLVALDQADLAGDPVAATAAARRLPPWGESDAIVGRLIAFQSITARDPQLAKSKLDAAIGWWAAAAARDPADPTRWDDLGGALEHAGRPDAAAAAYERALRDNPWSARAYAGLVRLGPPTVPAARVAVARAKLAQLGP
jgi:O-antigen ligase